MPRAHLYKVLTDDAGNVLSNVSVSVLTPGTATLITETMYTADTGGATVVNPFTVTDGVVDFYLDDEKRVRLGVFQTGMEEVFFDNVDVLKPGSGGVFRTGTGFASVIGGDLASNPVDGYDPSEANGVDALAIGSQAIADGNSSFAVGNVSEARGSQSVAVGVLAVAHGNQAMAVGRSSAAGDPVNPPTDPSNNQPVAIGNTAIAKGAQAMAVGTSAASYGTQGTAVGNTASATSEQGVAIGNTATAGAGWQEANADTTFGATAVGCAATASADRSTAVGNTAQALHARAVAIGADSATTAPDVGVWKNDAVEIVPSSVGGVETALILRDSTGARWEITVDTTGHLTTTAL